MIRTLLATTALAGLLATSAVAQDATTPAATPAPATDNATAATPTAGGGEYVQRLESDQYLASNLTGQDVYETNAPDARTIGEIQNFVIGNDGKAAAVVIATSGLDDDKTIAAPVDKIEWVMGNDNQQRAVLKGSVNELQSAPVFNAQNAEQAANNGAMAPGTGAMAPGGTAAPAAGGAATTDTAMAPNPGAAGTGNMAAGNSMAANNNMAATTGAQTGAMTGGASANGYLASLGNDQKLSEDIIGANVYSGPGNDAQTIGSVNDLVMSKDGQVAAVLIGVGGFLGIGEKDVGVPYSRVQMQAEQGDATEPRLIMASNRDELNNAPTFDEGDNNATANNAMAPATGTTNMAAGTATGMAAGTGAAGMATQGTDTTTAAQNTTATDTTNADTSTTASTGNANDRASMQPVSGPELTADNLDGATVYGPNDESIGSVGDIALTGDGRVDAVVVDVGGFLGIGAKPVAVAMDNLQFMRDTNGTVNIYTQFTEDQLRNAPEFNRESYAENRSTMRLESGNAPAPTGNNQAAPAAGTSQAQ